jgi:hypothetical protein
MARVISDNLSLRAVYQACEKSWHKISFRRRISACGLLFDFVETKPPQY